MTRKQFVERATKDAERALRIPAGWWGDYRNVFGPGGVSVRFRRDHWAIYQRGVRISKHDSRDHAIRKASKL